MRTKIKLMALMPLAVALISGCSATRYESSYFGYSNSKSAEKEEGAGKNQTYAKAESAAKSASSEDYDDADKWVNPLASESQRSSTNYAVVDNDYMSFRDVSYRGTQVLYVPVIVPWWSRYYGWSSYWEPGFSFNINYGPYWCYDWYSPWYDYHPYYGRYWAMDYYYPYHHWYHQPVYSHNSRPIDRDTRRTFGANRGAFSSRGGGYYDVNSTRSSGTINRSPGRGNRIQTGGNIIPGYRDNSSRDERNGYSNPRNDGQRSGTINRSPSRSSDNGRSRGESESVKRSSDNNSGRSFGTSGGRKSVERTPAPSSSKPAASTERSSGSSNRSGGEKNSNSGNSGNNRGR